MAVEFSSLFIEEPLLAFGERKYYIDPKMGLLAYGPCMLPNRRAISSTIRIGIIGSRETINLAQHWMNKCQREIHGKTEIPLLFQSFPGFKRIFGAELSIRSECMEVLKEAEIKRVLIIANFYQRVRSAAKLFIGRLQNLQVREPRPHVVICALPPDIVNSCGTKTGGYLQTRVRFTPKEREIMKIIKKHRRTGQTTLIPFGDRTLDMIPEASDLRRLIKAEAMSIGIP
ncbi:MAG: hypothetical protein ACETVN_02115, partial [Asgard group archaeon]